MVGGGYLVLGDGRCRVSAKGRQVAIIFSAIKRALRLGPGG